MSQFDEFLEDMDEPDEGDSALELNKCVDGGIGRENFYFGRTLGEGSYARVMHAKQKIENSPSYAVKIMEKSFIRKEKKVA